MQSLLVELLRGFTSLYGPLILVLEDVHHFDTASWRLMGAAMDALSPVVLFIATFR